MMVQSCSCAMVALSVTSPSPWKPDYSRFPLCLHLYIPWAWPKPISCAMDGAKQSCSCAMLVVLSKCWLCASPCDLTQTQEGGLLTLPLKKQESQCLLRTTSSNLFNWQQLTESWLCKNFTHNKKCINVIRFTICEYIVKLDIFGYCWLPQNEHILMSCL